MTFIQKPSFAGLAAGLPATPDEKFRQAVALYQQGNLVPAEKLLKQAGKKAPGNPQILHYLGLVALARGKLHDADKSLRRALAIQPDMPEVLCNRSIVLRQMDRLDEAQSCCDRALALRPDDPSTLNNRGEVFRQMGHLSEAIADYDRAIALKPDFASVWNNRGLALYAAGRTDEAVASLDEALKIVPGDAHALANRAIVLRRLNRFEDALSDYNRAIEAAPNHIEAIRSRGTIFKDLRRFDEAFADFERALALRPDDETSLYNRGLCRLLTDDFAQGWPDYENRPALREFNAVRRFRQPQWRGTQTLADRTVLLYAEQGLGDTIQFCRYAEKVAERGAKVVLEVQPALRSLMTDLPGVTDVIVRGDPLPRFDFHCPLLSLPLAFDTRPDTIPARRSYLAADPERLALWSSRLGPADRRRIGLVWSGNPEHGNDHNRSIPLTMFNELLKTGADCISLQKETRPEDAALLAETTNLHHFGPDLADFQDTAALVSLMDVVVSVDTSVAHLAAALGRPTWILLPWTPDWRWLLNRDDSPWYPTVRLFRQPERDAWQPALAAVRRELEALP